MTVSQPDGTTPSELYARILTAIQEGLPSEFASTTIASFEKDYVGKYLRNTDDPEEIALGLYLTLSDKKFTSWYGDWTAEPEMGEDLTFTNNQGVKRSIFEFTSKQPPIQDRFRSARTKATSRLIKQVDITTRELKDRIKLAIDAREKSKLNPEYTKDQKIERERYYNNIIKKLRQQIETLTKKNSVEYVLAQGISDMETVRKTLSGPIVSLTEIRFADDVVQAWDHIEKILGVDSLEDIVDEDLKERAIKISDEVGRNQKRLSLLAKKLLIEEYNKSMPEGREITVDDLKSFKDVSAWKMWARDITTVDNKIVQFLAKIINQANLRITKEHNRNYGRIDQAFEKIKDNAEIVQNGFNIFVKEQPGKLGGKTLGLVGRFSQEFYDAIRLQSRQLKINLEKAGEDREAVKLAYRNYNQWVNKNMVLFNSGPFINAKNHSDQERLQVISELKGQGFTEDEIADMIREAQRKFEKFEDDAEIYKTRIMLDIASGDIVLDEGVDEDTFVNNKVEEWKKVNDPVAYIEHMNSATFNSAEFKAFKGGRYSVKFPRKTVDGKDSKFYDANFEKIANDKDLYTFYTFFRDFIKDQLSYLPEEEIEDLQSNFLPVVAERLAKEYGFTGLKETAKNMGDWFFKQLTIVDYEKAKRTDPVTGKERYSFQSRFIDDDVDVEERSKDLVLMMKLFSDMALVYKHKIMIQDQVDSINDLIQAADSVVVEDKFGEKVKEKEAPKNLQNMVGSAILRSFYQVPAEAEGVIRKRRFYSATEVLTLGAIQSDKYKQAVQLQKAIEDLQNQLDNDTLKEDDRVELEKKLYGLKTEYYKLGGRTVSISSTLDALGRLTRLKGLGFNPFAAFRNLAIGGINNMVHAYGGEDFTMKEYGKATNIIKASSAKYISWGTVQSKDAMKILKINLDSKIVDGEDDIFKEAVLGVNKASTWETVKKFIPSPLTLMKSTDYLFKSQTSVAYLLSRKVVTSKGTFSLYDVMDENLEYNAEEFGEWLVDENGGKDFDEFYEDASAKIGQIAKKLHGFSGGGQSLAGKDKVFGRMLFIFKTWLPETIATRFEEKRYDPILERHTEGYYRTFWKRLVSEDEGLRVSGLLKDLYNAAMKAETGNLTAEEVANLRKMLLEMGAIVSLYGLHMLLSSAVSDDDDEKWKKLLVNQLALLNRDLTYYVNPYSIKGLTENVIPVVGTVTQTWDAISASAKYLAGVEDDDGDPEFDGERTILKITKALPYVNNINRVIYYSGRLGSIR